METRLQAARAREAALKEQVAELSPLMAELHKVRGHLVQAHRDAGQQTQIQERAVADAKAELASIELIAIEAEQELADARAHVESLGKYGKQEALAAREAAEKSARTADAQRVAAQTKAKMLSVQLTLTEGRANAAEAALAVQKQAQESAAREAARVANDAIDEMQEEEAEQEQEEEEDDPDDKDWQEYDPRALCCPQRRPRHLPHCIHRLHVFFSLPRPQAAPPSSRR